MKPLTPIQALVQTVGITQGQLAIAILITKPGITLTEVSRRVGVSRYSLYRDPDFRRAWQTYRLPDGGRSRHGVEPEVDDSESIGEQFEDH